MDNPFVGMWHDCLDAALRDAVRTDHNVAGITKLLAEAGERPDEIEEKMVLALLPEPIAEKVFDLGGGTDMAKQVVLAHTPDCRCKVCRPMPVPPKRLTK